MKDLHPELTKEKSKLAQTEPWLVLWQIDANKAGTKKYCLVAHDEEVEFDGVVYSPFPIVIGESSENSEGNLPQTNVTVVDVAREITADLKAANGFVGHNVKLIIVHKYHLDDPEAKSEATAKVLSCSRTQQNVSFRIGHTNFLGLPFPSERFTERCRWVYKSYECGYAGALTTCDKTLNGSNGCVAHGSDSSIHPARYGGFPTIPQ